jgi:hypothetical protein
MKMGEEMKFHVTINDRVSSDLVKIGILQKGINKGAKSAILKLRGQNCKFLKFRRSKVLF